MNKKILWLLLLWPLAPGVAAGVIDTLVVSGSEAEAEELSAPAGLHRLDVGRKQPGLRIDSAELLEGIPGVQADSRSNYAQDTRLTLRGFGARSAFGVRGIDLRLDGVPLATPDGQGQVSSVMLDEVASVEVLRGPLAALYGNGAGGVVALQTRAPEDNRLVARHLGGDNVSRRYALNGQWRVGGFGARVQSSQFSTNGSRPHSSAERNHVGAQLYFIADNGLQTTLRLDTSRDPLLQDPLGLTLEQWLEDPAQVNPATETFDTRKRVSHRQASLGLRQDTGPGRWRTAAWAGRRQVQQWLAFPGDAITASGGVVDLERSFAGFNGSYSHDLLLWQQPLTATLGAELTEMRDERLGYVNDFGESGDLRRDETGRVQGQDIYSLVEWRPGARWRLLGGARYSQLDFRVADRFIVPATDEHPGNPDDSGSRDYGHWSAALGGNYRLSEDWMLFAALGRGFETPTLTEMAYRREGTGLNTDLDAARNRQGEVGVRWGRSQGSHLELSLFEISSRREIVVDSSQGGRTTFRNAAATERQGVEFSGQLLLEYGWLARFSASYLDARYSGGEWQGNRLPGIARTQLYGQVDWQPWYTPLLTLSMVARHRDAVATADNNEIFAPRATTADLALSSEFDTGPWEVQLWGKLGNITDRRYVGSVIVNQANDRAFEPAPGRHWSLGLELAYPW